MAISAADVQRAYTNNLDIAGLLQNQQQLSQRRDMMDYQRRRDAAGDMYNFQKYIEDKYNIGTGTPLDRVTNDGVQKAQNALYEAMKLNKRPLTTAEMMQVASPYLSGIPAKQQAAKAIRTSMEKRRTTFDKDNPELDWNLFEPEAIRRAFYDENGQIRQDLDPMAFENFYEEIQSNPEMRDRFINERQLQSLLQQNLKNVPQVPVQVPMPKLNGVYLSGSRLPYQTIDLNSRSPVIANDPVFVGDQQIEALPAESMEQLMGIPHFSTAVRVAARNLPEEIPVEDRQRIAARQIVGQYGPSVKPLNVDWGEYDRNYRQKRDAQANYYRSRADQRAERNADLAEQREQRLASNQQGTDRYADLFAGAVNGDADALSKMKKVKVPGMGIDLYDITAAMPGQDGMIPAKDGSGDKLKVFSNGSEVYEVRYRKDPATGEMTPFGGARKLGESGKRNLINSTIPSLRGKAVSVDDGIEPNEALNIDESSLVTPQFPAQPQQPTVNIQIDPNSLKGIFD